ncbi:MAG: hypothetical protein SF069_08025 [Phycisphaerae bacterium]|nr:hypothetical protein [Phycisphaerae bacterium]
MGDIFWDFDDRRDAPLDFVTPSKIATNSVASCLRTLAASLESNSVYPISLRLEYRELLARMGRKTEDADIVASLISEAAWTEEGARKVLQLAQTYGVSVLRNALALAEALDIEDGAGGL